MIRNDSHTIARLRFRWGALPAVVLCAASSHLLGEMPDPPAEDPAASQRLLDRVGPGFKLRHADFFTIAYDTPHATLASLVGILKGTHMAIWSFAEQLRLPARAPANRLHVILYDSFDDYLAHCARAGVQGNGVAGFFSQEENLAVFCNVLNRPELAPVTARIDALTEEIAAGRTGGLDASRRAALLREKRWLESQLDDAVSRNNRLIIRHEAAHQVLFNLGIHVFGAQNPGWLAEGMACQFEVAQRVGPAGLQKINHPRLADFREAFDMGPRAKGLPPGGLSAALDARRFVPLEELIGNADLFQHAGPHTAARYAQGWALVFYLQRAHPDAFAAYLRLLAQRRPGVRFDANRELQDFASAFGPPDDAFQRAWLTFMLSQPFDRRAAGR